MLSSCVATRSAGGKSPTVSSFRLSAELDELIETAMNQLGAVAGLSVAIYSPEGSYTQGFGVADVGTGEAVNADTCFYIASATKPLTALALVSLSGAAAINLDATLSDFAADAPFPPSLLPGQVTLRHLLSHRSGIRCDPIAVRLAFSGQHSPAELWRLLGTGEVNTDAPFGVFGYTNTGYNIATILTDRRSEQPWQDILEQQLFDPAGMLNATARMSTAKHRGASIAKPHAFMPEGISKLYLEKSDQTMHSAGGVVMSANDAVRWLELMAEAGMLGGLRVVQENAILETRKPLAHVSTEFAGYSRQAYGLGWYHVPFRDQLMLQHFGSFAGARAHVSYIPALRTGVAIFANDSTVGAPIVDAIANYAYDRTAGRADARSAFDTGLAKLILDRDRYVEHVVSDRVRRSAREWKLSRDFRNYAGVYKNPAFGEIEIRPTVKGFDVRFGVMHAAAEPGTDVDVIRVELVPGSGELLSFQAGHAALEYNGAVYQRA